MSVENSNMEDINVCQHKMAEISYVDMRCFRSECRGERHLIWLVEKRAGEQNAFRWHEV